MVFLQNDLESLHPQLLTPVDRKEADCRVFLKELEKSKTSILSILNNEITSSKMFKFVCWTRDLDEPSEITWKKSALKTVVAVFAVLGMVVLTPCIIGIFLLYDFYQSNKFATDLLNEGKDIQKQKETDLEELSLCKSALGGLEALKLIPVIENEDEFSVRSRLKSYCEQKKKGYITGICLIRFEKKEAEEMENLFKKYKTSIFQSDGNLLALHIENNSTQKQGIVFLCDWGSVDQIRLFKKRLGVGLYFENENTRLSVLEQIHNPLKASQFFGKIIAGTDETYQLVSQKYL